MRCAGGATLLLPCAELTQGTEHLAACWGSSLPSNPLLLACSAITLHRTLFYSVSSVTAEGQYHAVMCVRSALATHQERGRQCYLGGGCYK